MKTATKNYRNMGMKFAKAKCRGDMREAAQYKALFNMEVAKENLDDRPRAREAFEQGMQFYLNKNKTKGECYVV